MPKMHIEKSITIDAPIDQVYAALNDFHNWPSWSPWLIAEPECKVDVREDGKYYEWEGNRIGSGNMTVLEEKAPNYINYDLTFLKPWKSTAKTYFNCKENNGSTEVSWGMDSSLPFFMFWMKKQMEAFVGSDYDRGLAMLKSHVEKGEIESTLNFKGRESYPGCNYVGIKRQIGMAKMPEMMAKDFGKLGELAKSKPDQMAGGMFSIYHKWDMVKGQVSYTAGLPVTSEIAGLTSDFITGAIPATSVYTLQHVGSYKHLGNAWSTINMMARNKEFKAIKGIHPFETYENNPEEVEEKDLITNIHFAIK